MTNRDPLGEAMAKNPEHIFQAKFPGRCANPSCRGIQIGEAIHSLRKGGYVHAACAIPESKLFPVKQS